jgi:hypothetical protein
MDMAIVPDPWSGLPGEIAPQMRAQIPDLSAAMVATIQNRLPVYGGRPDARAIHRGAAHALDEFIGRVRTGDRSLDSAAQVHRALGGAGRGGAGRGGAGRGGAERSAGRTLDSMRSAYLVGARLAWQRWITVGDAAKVPPGRM